MNKKTIKNHYGAEAKKFGASAKCTMIDLFTRNLEVAKLDETIDNLLKGKKFSDVLEIGCGNGYTMSKLVKKFNANFTGIDSNEEMIKIASGRKLKNVKFLVNDVLKTDFNDESFDIVYSERCLINLQNWNLQKKALSEIHRIIRKGGYYVMLEAFNDGLKELNNARKSVGLKEIPPAWHNCYFNKSLFEKYLKGKFVSRDNLVKIKYDNFLSSYYFGSRVLYPSLIEGKKSLFYNNNFVKYFSLLPNVGNYSQLQLCVIKKT